MFYVNKNERRVHGESVAVILGQMVLLTGSSMLN